MRFRLPAPQFDLPRMGDFRLTESWRFTTMQHSDFRMTEGGIAGQMVRFAVPLFIGNLFQQLYNTADALIVGRMLGNDALAAVSATGNLNFLIISFFMGIAAGSSVLISRYYGAEDREKLSAAIHTNLLFSLAAGVLMTLIGVTLTPTLLRWMDTPEDVMELSVTYTRIFFAGSLGLVLYNGLRGVMQAVGDSRHPLYYLVFSSALNVVLDIAFIGLFHTGVGGAALATILAQFLSGLLCLRRLLTTDAEYRVSMRELRFDPKMFRLILLYGLPSGVQNSVIGLANVVVQANINIFGTMAVAGCGAYGKLEGFAFLPVTSFTIALTTFVGQNLGAARLDRAKRGAAFGVVACLIASELTGLLLYLAAPALVGLFTVEPEAIAFGVGKSRICALFFFLLAASHSLAAVLRGAGKATIPMISMLSFWCVVRVGFLRVAVPIWHSIDVVNWVYPLTWFLSTVFLCVYTLKADWVHSFERERV